MHGREVTPQEAPELHGIIDRLCALADMPKPRVAIADTDMPNAFATGRNQKQRGGLRDHRASCAGWTAQELEGVLAHEMSHVAHQDVAVMTIASFLGIIAGLMARFALYSELFGGRSRDDNGGLPIGLIILLVSVVVYAISFLLIRVLSRYRELAADRAGALLTSSPRALASALVKVSGDIGQDPDQGPARRPAVQRVLLRPRPVRDSQPGHAVVDPPAAGAPAGAARQDLRAQLAERRRPMGFLDALLGRTKPARPTWTRCSRCRRRR